MLLKKLAISKTKFYQIYLTYPDFLQDIFEYSLEKNNPIKNSFSITNLVYQDLSFIIKQEVAFRNLLFISRHRIDFRQSFLEKSYYQRLYLMTKLYPQVNFWKNQEIILQLYVDYALNICLPWIEQGSLNDNKQPWIKLITMSQILFNNNNLTKILNNRSNKKF